MGMSKFGDSQMANILKKAEDGLAVAEVARKHGIGAVRLYARLR